MIDLVFFNIIVLIYLLDVGVRAFRYLRSNKKVENQVSQNVVILECETFWQFFKKKMKKSWFDGFLSKPRRFMLKLLSKICSVFSVESGS